MPVALKHAVITITVTTVITIAAAIIITPLLYSLVYNTSYEKKPKAVP
jgi:uncharacterized phage infection (PIP) family protein YhgE